MSKLLTHIGSRHVQQTLQYGSESIPYLVIYTSIKKSNIRIDVIPNGKVHVISPEGIALSNVKQAVQKRARWVYKHVEKARIQLSYVLPRQYVSGECHYYLGRRYVLKVFAIRHGEPGVKLLRGQLQVRTKSREREAVKTLLNSWYRLHAEEVINRRLMAIYHQANWLRSPPKWKLRVMKNQWGSCSPTGVLSLNPQLVKAPRECIDYVIFHELCHIKEHNHSSKYYRLLKSLVPDWKATKARLDGMSELFLAG